MCFQEAGKENSHSRRHLKRLYPSSEAPPPRTPNKAAPARRHHGNREPASLWWEVSFCWHSKDTQSWGRSEKRQKHVWVHKQDKIVGLKLWRVKKLPSASPVVGSCYHVLLINKLDTVDGTSMWRHNNDWMSVFLMDIRHNRCQFFYNQIIKWLTKFTGPNVSYIQLWLCKYMFLLMADDCVM